MTRLPPIRRRAEKALPGPWVVGVDFDQTGWPVYRIRDVRNFSDDALAANARFIAHAREDIPYLLGLVEQLRDALQKIGNRAGSPTMSYSMPIENQERERALKEIAGIVIEALAASAEGE